MDCSSSDYLSSDDKQGTKNPVEYSSDHEVRRSTASVPHQPKLKFPKSSLSKKKHVFCSTWYQQYPWLNYVPEDDLVLCFYCATAAQLKIPMAGYVDSYSLKQDFVTGKRHYKHFISMIILHVITMLLVRTIKEHSK